MERGTSRGETNSFCIILSADVAHKLCHAVAVVVGWFEGVLSYQPSRREYHEVETGSA